MQGRPASAGSLYLVFPPIKRKRGLDRRPPSPASPGFPAVLVMLGEAPLPEGSHACAHTAGSAAPRYGGKRVLQKVTLAYPSDRDSDLIWKQSLCRCSRVQLRARGWGTSPLRLTETEVHRESGRVTAAETEHGAQSRGCGDGMARDREPHQRPADSSVLPHWPPGPWDQGLRRVQPRPVVLPQGSPGKQSPSTAPPNPSGL